MHLPQIRSRACLLTGSLSVVSGTPLPHPLKGICHLPQGIWCVARSPCVPPTLEQTAVLQGECEQNQTFVKVLSDPYWAQKPHSKGV